MPSILQIILGLVMILSAIGVLIARKPVHACLSFLLMLFTLSVYYLQLSAQFIAVMQILVYAGAILVIFMFVIVLFQDAYLQIDEYSAKSSTLLLSVAGVTFLLALGLFLAQLLGLPSSSDALSENFGMVQSIGRALYLDFFLPFELIIVLFLVAVIGSFYIGKREAS